MKFVLFLLSAIIGSVFALGYFNNQMGEPTLPKLSLGFLGVICSLGFNYLVFERHPNTKHTNGIDIVYEGFICVCISIFIVIGMTILMIFNQKLLISIYWMIILFEFVFSGFINWYLHKRYSIIQDSQ